MTPYDWAARKAFTPYCLRPNVSIRNPKHREKLIENGKRAAKRVGLA